MFDTFINRIIVYLRSDSSVSFWHLPICESDWHEQTDSFLYYYIDFSTKLKYNAYFDESHVIKLNYYGNIGIQYNPAAVSQFGLGALTQYLKTGETRYRDIAEEQCSWLCSQLSVDDMDKGSWFYMFGSTSYNHRQDKWISAISQAQGISLLLRMHYLTGDAQYLDTAKKAFNVFRYSVDEGGLLRDLSDGGIVLEEAPTVDRVSCILDGYMYAILGVYDYWKCTDDVYAMGLFYNCVKTLARLLPQFDLGYWSRADIYSLSPKMPSSFFYHKLHIDQLRILYKLTNEVVFLDFARIWEKNFTSSTNRVQALVSKVWFKLRHY